MKPEISFLFVNYDSGDYLMRSLRSIIDDSIPVPYEVIVIDNASKEGLPLSVTAVWPWVRLFISDENLGFARAAN
ncbi:MAG: glycosyltransferase, partial [candidate division WOR-3 bacterium]